MRQRGGEAPGSAIGRDGAADRSAPGGGSAHIRAAAPRAAPAQRRQPPTEVGDGTERGNGGGRVSSASLLCGARGGVGHATRIPLPAVSPGFAAHRGYLGVTRSPAVPARCPSLASLRIGPSFTSQLLYVSFRCRAAPAPRGAADKAKSGRIPRGRGAPGGTGERSPAPALSGFSRLPLGPGLILGLSSPPPIGWGRGIIMITS